MEDEQLIYAAGCFAYGAHAGQVRKYTGVPYINHCLNVAELVESVPHTTTMIAASLLHDTIEDTGATDEIIRLLFGDGVADYVILLTDEYTAEKYPHTNREARKRAEAMRYSGVPNEVKTIKLADMIDNTESIGEHDPKSLKTYGPEKRRLLDSLVGGDKGLWKRADRILTGYGY